MTHLRRLAASALAASLALLIGLTAAGPSGATGPRILAANVQLPQAEAARQAAQWLGSQLTPQGYFPTAPGSGQANLSTTANVVLALAAANVDLSGARSALSYLQANVVGYVPNNGANGPAQLAQLILDAAALGADPRSFGGTDLVAELLATEQTSGTDAGLFGTENQATNYAAGTYQQGLALAALAAAGVRGPGQLGAAITWLVNQQCPDGGWVSPDIANNACGGNPSSYQGPDTNSTALAVEGLAAQGVLTPAISAGALGFLTGAQDADGGWPYFPGTPAAPVTSDPDSTALVMQGLLALGVSPTSAALTKGSANPVSALLSFRLTSGSDAGAFFLPPAPAPANTIATYQAVPALAGLSLPFGLPGHGYWLTGADGGVFAFGGAGYYGSLPSLGVHVSDVRALAPTGDGKGYWLTGADGGVFAFGDARYQGSLPGLGVHVSDIVGTVATPDGGGYFMVGADGGVFAFGDAGYVGSLPGLGVHVSDIVGITPTADGGGYWVVGADGGVFAFGDAGYVGSLPADGMHTSSIVGITPTADAAGYLLASSSGGVFAFGDAVFAGSAATAGVSDIVGIATSPARSA